MCIDWQSSWMYLPIILLIVTNPLILTGQGCTVHVLCYVWVENVQFEWSFWTGPSLKWAFVFFQSFSPLIPYCKMGKMLQPNRAIIFVHSYVWQVKFSMRRFWYLAKGTKLLFSLYTVSKSTSVSKLEGPDQLRKIPPGTRFN